MFIWNLNTDIKKCYESQISLLKIVSLESVAAWFNHKKFSILKRMITEIYYHADIYI